MSTVEERMQLPSRDRYRCFWSSPITLKGCLRLAKFRVHDETRADAATFYCEHHRPKSAAMIEDDSPYLAVEVAAVLTLGASTLRADEAGRIARTVIQRVLEEAGIRAHIVGTTAGLMAPRARRIFGAGGPDS